LAKVDVLRQSKVDKLNEINAIALKYTPESSVQFYFDLLVRKAQEIDLIVDNISTRSVSVVSAQEAAVPSSVQTTLSAAIHEYKQTQIVESDEEDEQAANPETPVVGRLEFKYVPLDLSINADSFEQLQEYLRIIKEEELSIHYPTASYAVTGSQPNNRISMNFTIYFVSIDSLEDPVDIPTYEIPEEFGPAEKEDVFFYMIPKDDV
jgi:hypothetical protein